VRPSSLTNNARRGVKFFLFVILLVGFAAKGLNGQDSVAKRSSDSTGIPSQAPMNRTYLGAFNPKSQRPISAQAEGWSLILKQHAICKGCPSGETFLFEIHNKRTRFRTKLRITNLTAQIDEVHIFDKFATIVGRAAPNTSVINVVDLATGALRDTVVCIRPAVSPHKRFVAFVRFFPAHSGQSPTFQYMLYDVSKKPEENRLAGVAASNQWDAGIPIYPDKATQPLSPNVLQGEGHIHSMATDGFFWLDDNAVAFVDRSGGVNRLVVVNLRGGANQASVASRTIPTSGIVDLARCRDAGPKDLERWSKDPAMLIYVVNVRQSQEKKSSLTLDFNPTNPCLQRTSLDIRLDEPPPT